MREETLLKKLNIETKKEIRKKMQELEEMAIDNFMENSDFYAPDFLEPEEAEYFEKYYDFFMFDDESVFKK